MQLSIVSSSLSALDQVQQTKDTNRKHLWLVCFALSSLAAICQTAYVLDSYFRPSMSISVNEEINDVNAAATFCMNEMHGFSDDEKDIIHKMLYESSEGKCVDSTSIQRWTNFDSQLNQYNYSYKSCLDQCIHELTKTYCHCILPKSMVDSNYQQLPICSTICNHIPEDKLNAMCKCKPTCRYVEFGWIEQVSASENEDTQLAYSISIWIEMKYTTLEDILKLTQGSRISTTLQLLKSSSTSVSYMKPTVKLVDALSMVGGVWGLWVGLSISVILSMGISTLKHVKGPAVTFTSHPKGHQYASVIDFMQNMLWWMGILTIVMVNLWQIYLAINEYLQYKTIQVVTTEPQSYNSFPVVYVCSNTKMFYNNDTLSNDAALAKKLDHWHSLKVKNFYEELRQIPPNNFTNDEKLSMLPSLSDFLTFCEFHSDIGNAISCILTEKKLITIHFNPDAKDFQSQPRVCAIINPAISEFEHINVQSLNISLKFPKDDSVLEFISTRICFDPFCMYENNAVKMPFEKIEVASGSRADIKFLSTETKRLPHPYTSKCVPNNTTYSVWPEYMGDFGLNLTYAYTYKMCLQLCFLRLMEEEIDCELLITNTTCYLEYKDTSACGCRYPCRSIEYHFKMSETRNVYKKKTFNGHYNSVSELRDYMWSGESIVNIARDSSYKTVVIEKPAIPDDSLVGILGGISGLWIGQSILNFFIELQMLFVLIFKNLFSFNN